MTSGVGLVFPGQGSQAVGMGQGLYAAHPDIQQCYDQASALLGYDIGTLCFQGPADRLNLTEFTQPALLVSSIAALRVFEGLGVQPVAVAGHSMGEYTALVAAGGLSFIDALSVIQKRAQYMAEAVPPGTGLVAAVMGLSREAVQKVCSDAASEGMVCPANFNCPGQTVVAGEKAGVERALVLAKKAGSRKAITLPVSVPVHTSLMEPAATRLAPIIDSLAWSDLRVPLVSNVEARPVQSASEVRASLVRQLASPVLWEDSIRRMAELGVSTFIEIGPGSVLSGLIKRILPEVRTLRVSDPASLHETEEALGKGAGS